MELVLVIQAITRCLEVIPIPTGFPLFAIIVRNKDTRGINVTGFMDIHLIQSFKTSSAANMCDCDMNTQQAEEKPKMGKQMPLNLSKDQYEQILNILGTIQDGNGFLIQIIQTAC